MACGEEGSGSRGAPVHRDGRGYDVDGLSGRDAVTTCRPLVGSGRSGTTRGVQRNSRPTNEDRGKDCTSTGPEVTSEAGGSPLC